MSQPVEEFTASIGVTMNDISLMEQAFTHRSFLNEGGTQGMQHNERLEFLGDAVLEVIVTYYLFHKYPDHPEGHLTAFRSSLVNTHSISEAARILGMEAYLRLSKGEQKDTGKARQYILANTFEAVIGALYLDQPFEVVQKFVADALFHKIDEIVEAGTWKDPKSWVQEKAQEVIGVTPSYDVLEESGPDHDKHFVIGIYFGDDLIAQGEGRSKQEAQQAAAQAAIEVQGWK